MADFTAPVAFAFILSITGEDAAPVTFQEVSGLNAETEIVQLREGGENAFGHRLPGDTRHQNLVLKRGLVPGQSELATWFSNTLSGDFAKPIQTKDLTVSLLKTDGTVVMVWDFHQAWPVKWQIAPLTSEQDEFAIETLEFAYQSVERRLSDLVPKEPEQ